MICDKCDNVVCKAYKGTCRKYRLLRLITFEIYGKSKSEFTYEVKFLSDGKKYKDIYESQPGDTHQGIE